MRRCIHGKVVTGNSSSQEITSPRSSSASTITFMPEEVLVVKAISSGSALMNRDARSNGFALRQPAKPVNVAIIHHLLVVISRRGVRPDRNGPGGGAVQVSEPARDRKLLANRSPIGHF